MLIIQALIGGFSLFAITKAVLRFRQRTIGLSELVLWSSFWAAVGGLVMAPQVSQWFANVLGVGRGADATLYVAVVGLSYGFFRLYLKTRAQDQQITKLVRRLALDEAEAAALDEAEAAERSASRPST